MADTDYLSPLIHALPGSMVFPLAKRLAQGVADTVKIPGDVYRAGYGGYQFDPQELVGPANQMALTTLGGSSAAALPMQAAGKLDATLPAMFLKNKKTIFESSDPAGLKAYGHDIVNEEGERTGTLTTTYNPKNKNINVEHISSAPYSENSFGPANTRSLISALQDEYPDAQTLSGYRVSGARRASGSVKSIKPGAPNWSANTWINLPNKEEP
jgi:hypothetical protein